MLYTMLKWCGTSVASPSWFKFEHWGRNWIRLENRACHIGVRQNAQQTAPANDMIAS